MSIQEAERLVGFHIPRPHDDLADDATARVFVAGGPGQPHHSALRIGIDYRSGILMWLERARGRYASAPLDFYREREQSIHDGAFGQGAVAEVQSILGVPALVTQNCEGWGDVDLVINGLRIELAAGWDKFDAATLVTIASTIL
jgi:hypothetical protein